MGATITAIGAWFSGTAATAGTAVAGTAAAGTVGTVAAAPTLASVATSAAVTAGTAAVANKLLRPDVDIEKQKALPMPDPLEQAKARERSLIEQMSRSGRASTILTDTKLGG